MAICALAGAAFAMFTVWAFGVRGSDETMYVTVEASGNPAEDRWAAQICTAVAAWERPWVKTVVVQRDQDRVPLATTIETMRVLTNRLRTDIDQIVPPTDRTRRWQRYIAKTAREWEARFSKLEPIGFSLIRDVVPPVGDISDSVRSTANLVSPHLGVLFAEAKACDEVDRYSLTGKPWP